jgi:pimeloyl-ACP methyl ester carboxylesterase
MRMLLLHGGGLGGWIWERMLPELTTPAETVERAGTVAAWVERLSERLEERTIIVGHSFSAHVALAAATRHRERVAAVVLVGGVIAPPGKPFVSLLPIPMRWFLTLLIRRSRNGVALPKGLVRKEYCSDLDETTTEMVLSRVVREEPRLYLDRVDWSPVRTFYVKLLRDRSASVKQQDEMIARVGAERVETIDGGHLAMLSRPHELAAALERIAGALSTSP